jgi:uncharacterized membrane protein YccF (DUF307 family)
MGNLEPVPGWWQASDGQWYPPPAPPTPSPIATTVAPPSPPAASSTTVIVNAGPHVVVQPGPAPGAASTLANLIWLVVGVPLAFGYLFAGILNCLFVVTIPFGLQAFKLAGYALWPFGRVVVERPGRDVALSTLGNVIWFLTGGVWLALFHVVFGLLACATIIGIPFGIASFKMAGLALTPFGKMIVRRDQVAAGMLVVGSVPQR